MRTSPLFVFALLLTIRAVEPAVASADKPAVVVPTEPQISDADRDHWAFRPLADIPLPEDSEPRWNRHPIDRLVRAAQQRAGVSPLPRAGRGTLLRRVCFDLTGLPPTPQQIEAFLGDSAPDAYERLVDRLLASPAYGRRWAQHWLDLARFAETDGFEHDLVRPNAWRYRDWVIDALDRDLPYDEFVRLQLAGDVLHPDDPNGAIATGFLLAGPDMPDLNLVEERRHVVLNEMTSTVSAVLLGLQMGCAQCHDHKYDPISQYDFYRLRAFFEPSDIFRDHPVATPEQLAARRAAESAWTPEDHARAKRVRELEELGRKRFRERNPDELPTPEQLLGELSETERSEHASSAEQIAGLPSLPELPRGRVMRQGAAREAHFYARGDFRQPGPIVECTFPRVLVPMHRESADGEETTTVQPHSASRVALADWITRADNPLPLRVIVNRLWQWHFGVGLSATPSDFGSLGDEPVNLALVDWLARRFADDGRSFKKFHRLLLTSETYKLASAPYDAGWSAEDAAAARTIWNASASADPDNAHLWRRRRLRREGESLRDAMLLAGDRLSERRGGPGIRPPLPPEVTETLLKDQWLVTGDEADHRRASIYLFARRNLRYPLFDVFDRPEANDSCPRRHESTTATQSLVLLNSQFSLDCARALAAVVSKDAADRATCITLAYLRVFGRPPSEAERREALAFLERQEQLLAAEPDRENAPPDDTDRAALADLCLALLNSSEFLYVD